jgi:small-conductance mechanosensitive channel
MVDARKNLLDTMVEFVDASDPIRAQADALKTHIDAIAATVPRAAAGATMAAPSATAPSGTASSSAVPLASAPSAAAPPSAAPQRYGIWDLAANVASMRSKLRTIETVDARTSELAATFKRESSAPLARLEALSAESDALGRRAATEAPAGAPALRRDFDTLAWLFKQTSSILLPLTQEQVLLGQYRHNLADWRTAARRQYRDALTALGIRFGALLGLLAVVFLLGELWRRAVSRFVQEPRRRAQWLLLRRIVTWLVAVLVVALSITTEISTFATFAGLLTAGLAVALQSVLVSVVGYFFLIGKYGIRVGDRIQIGTVVGEVVDLGLVRMHLLELNAGGPLGPTGRVVAFANLIVFQASGGLFKQIPDVNLAWHETSLRLPDGADYASLKERLSAAVVAVTAVYHADVLRQTRRIATETVTGAPNDVTPTVQMRLADGHMEAVIGYPVHAPHIADIDERVATALLGVLAS